MKLTIFRSSKGDALLISSPGNQMHHHALFDGGLIGSFEKSVAQYLNNEIHQKGESLDLVCVTHIDDDHIAGIIRLMELVVDWRIFHYKQHINEPANPPALSEPPPIDMIWYNAFAETYELGSSVPRIEQALHIIQQLTGQSIANGDEKFRELHEIATSIHQGITLAQYLQPQQLNIPLNPQWDGKILKCNQRSVKKNSVDIGSMKFTILGPFTSDLTILKEEWEAWEQSHAEELTQFFSDLNLTALRHPLSTTRLKQLLTASGSMGDRDDVTIPNLASIIVLVEVGGRSILMTGDSHADDILKGLKKNKKLDAQERIHVDILKVQHHGATANIHGDFCDKVTADHYVFCGNGTHHNPESDVIELIFNHRQNATSDFTFHFNTNPNDDLTANQTAHMKALNIKLDALNDADASGHFKFRFIPVGDEFMQIDL